MRATAAEDRGGGHRRVAERRGTAGRAAERRSRARRSTRRTARRVTARTARASRPRIRSSLGGPKGTFDFASDFKIPRTIGNYWPYATTLFDYIRRAMPLTAPGSLTADQTYAVTAYLLNREGLLPAGRRCDARSLPAIQMPARSHFVLTIGGVPAGAREGCGKDERQGFRFLSKNAHVRFHESICSGRIVALERLRIHAAAERVAAARAALAADPCRSSSPPDSA